MSHHSFKKRLKRAVARSKKKINYFSEGPLKCNYIHLGEGQWKVITAEFARGS
jgi:hypothetical protein